MKRIIVPISALILMSITVGACGGMKTPVVTVDPGMSDEEFAAEASLACYELWADLEFTETLEEDSEAFREAAEKLMEFDLNPETAPQAGILLESLAALPEACLAFSAALDLAAEEKEWGDYTWMLLSGPYKVYGYSLKMGVLGITELDIDETVVKDYVDNYNALSESAEMLGLEGCHLNRDS